VFYSFLSLITKEVIKKMENTLKIYCLYSIDSKGATKFCGRFASKHRAEAAARGLGLTTYFFDEDAKDDEYGSVNINAALKSTIVR
jgi:hypothetical protein